MSVDESNVIEKIIEELQKTQETLMVCAVESRNCKKCKERNLCLIYMRSVIASLCRIEIARLIIEERPLPEGLYV